MFWVADPMPIVLAALMAVLVFFTAHLVESRLRWVVWLDSFALAIAVPAGTGAAIELGHGPVIVVLMGMATGAFGGLMRDVVCNEVPLVLKQGEPYVSCAMIGAMSAITLVWMELPLNIALLVCAAVTWASRASALLWGWSLPVYKSRPPRQ